ncbi:NADPH-dependent FMN reductase [Streptomyces sp. NBC_01613]|uniref:NADPH-dependent FMN reductase n=1 Tax=Streptomyces sp. NBC_01613 TaxID=2975896 RepID=UPI00386C39F7
MPTILAVSGSPSPVSFTHRVLTHTAERLGERGHLVDVLAVRALPAAELLAADTTHPDIATAVRQFTEADAVVLATPVYKAAYSGLLKAFLDLLPQFALADKVVLPLATGGSLAHVLALDYGLRPVLMSMQPAAVAESFFVHAEQAEAMAAQLDGATDRFADLVETLHRQQPARRLAPAAA